MKVDSTAPERGREERKGREQGRRDKRGKERRRRQLGESKGREKDEKWERKTDEGDRGGEVSENEA